MATIENGRVIKVQEFPVEVDGEPFNLTKLIPAETLAKMEAVTADIVEGMEKQQDGRYVLPVRDAAPAFDPSDLDALPKAFKALALCVAEVGGLSVKQMATLFKTKWSSLS